MARVLGIFVDETDTVVCEETSDELVASARLGKVGCVSSGNARAPACPARTVREEGACAALDARGVTDLARWTRAAAVEACTRASRSSVALRALESEVEVEVSAVVPNNDLTQGFVRIRARAGRAGDVDPAEIERIGKVLDDALRRLAGTGPASASEALASASCRVSQRRPISVP